MIESIYASNFRSLGSDAKIRFGPLTILVGTNGSGKSNALDSLQFVADCMRIGLEGSITKRHGIRAVRRWSSGHPHNVSITLKIKGNDFRAEYSFSIAGAKEEEYRVASEDALITKHDGSVHKFRIREGDWLDGPHDLKPSVTSLNLALPLVAGDSRFKPLADQLRSIAVYSIFPDTLRKPQKYDPTKPMQEHGENWVSILKDQPKAEWNPELVSALSKLTGDIRDIRIKPVAGFLTAQFMHYSNKGSRNKWFESNQESDGTLRVAGILTSLIQQPPLTVIGVEEPELTIHPGAIPLLVDFLKQPTKNSQVVITTHSPDLLDHVDADDVRVVEFKDGITTIKPIADEQKQLVQEKLMSLGEIMRDEGLQQIDLPLE